MTTLNKLIAQCIQNSHRYSFNQCLIPLQNYIKYNINDWQEYKCSNDEQIKKLKSLNLQVEKHNGYNKIFLPKLQKSQSFDVVIITWKPFGFTNYHIHSDNGCCLGILEGKIREQRCNKDTIMTFPNVSFIHNNMGAHKMSNCLNTYSYSIHMYSYVSPIIQNELFKNRYFNPNDIYMNTHIADY